MCRWENENWPIHLPDLNPKFDPYIYQGSEICPEFEKCLQDLCSICQHFGDFGFSNVKILHLTKYGICLFLYNHHLTNHPCLLHLQYFKIINVLIKGTSSCFAWTLIKNVHMKSRKINHHICTQVYFTIPYQWL